MVITRRSLSGLAVVLFVFGVMPGLAQDAQPFGVRSGNDVYEGIGACHSLTANSENDQVVRCFVTSGYLDGVTQTLGSLGLIAPPGGVTHGQIEDVVHRYLDIHPENRQKAAVTLILLATREAWPAQSSKNKKRN